MEKRKKEIYLFSDLDGTLGSEDGGIPERNRDAVRRFVEQGGKFGLCTGRSPDSAARFVGDLPVNLPCIVNGGCALYDFSTGEQWDEQFLPESALDFAADLLKELPYAALAVVNREGYWRAVSPKRGRAGDRYRPCPPSEIAKPWYRLILIDAPERTGGIAAAAIAQKPEGIRIERTAPDFVEILPGNTGKWAALERMCRAEKIPLKRVAFVGDFYNDMEALRHVEFSACVQEAPGEIKECCRWTLGPCMDGVLEEFLELICKDR